MKVYRYYSLLCLTCLFLWGGAASGQDYGSRLGTQRGGKVSFQPQGSGVMFGAMDPAVKKWYIPQELYSEYGWRQWEYSNYSRDPYQRYVSTTLEGDYFYDFYGNFIGRGWLVYDWRQDQPQQLGSSIFQNSRFSSWFNSVTIGGDSKGEYHYSITVGDRIRTTLTPMTFSKPTFNGVQIDFSSDKYAATVLASRASEPIRGTTNQPITRTNATSLFGGRATFQLGDFIELGATLVDGERFIEKRILQASIDAAPTDDEQRLSVVLQLSSETFSCELRFYLPGVKARESQSSRVESPETLPEHLNEIGVELSAELASLELPLQDVLNLEEGDVLALGPRSEMRALITLNGRAAGTATYGRDGEHLALRVEEFRVNPNN